GEAARRPRGAGAGGGAAAAARRERAALERDRVRPAGREPAVGARDHDLEVELRAARAREPPPRDEDRGAVGLIVLGPEAAHLERELVQAERLDQELDRDAAEALEQRGDVALAVLAAEAPVDVLREERREGLGPRLAEERALGLEAGVGRREGAVQEGEALALHR